MKRKPTKRTYNFVCPAGHESRVYPIEAYTEKQAKFLFEKFHGKVYYCNIIKDKLK